MFELLKEGPYTCIHCGDRDNRDVYKIYGDHIQYHSRSPSSAAIQETANANSNDNNGNRKKISNKSTPRLTRCHRCDELVDEYVQLDSNILYLDAILQKRTFYRHILLNCRINSNKSALKMAIIFYFCDAFQRWATSNNVVFTSEKSRNASATATTTKTYFQLEVSFYYNFLCIILESLLFNLLFYLCFKLSLYLIRQRGATGSDAVSLPGSGWKDVFMSLVICSYGKLFLIPSNLYGGDLKPILDILIYAFYFYSLVQCTMVKSHDRLNLFQSFCLVLATSLLHQMSVQLFHWLQHPFNSNINKLQYFLV